MKGCHEHMLAGMELLALGKFRQALEHFDQAMAIREALPWREDAESAWMLAAAAINRSDALRGMGEPGKEEEILRCLDIAIAAMDHVPLADHPAFPERLILAWIHRAAVRGEAGDFEDAARAFAEAESIFQQWGRETTPERVLLQAMWHVERARGFAGNSKPMESWTDARAAVALLKTLPAEGPVIEARIRAQSLQCHALALLLDVPGALDSLDDWIAEATDSAEEALGLVKRQGAVSGGAADLVRYAAMIYRRCQPQFLGEFLGEWLGDSGPLRGDETLRRDMEREFLMARATVEQKIIRAAHETEFVQKQFRILEKLQAAEGVLFPGPADGSRRSHNVQLRPKTR